MSVVSDLKDRLAATQKLMGGISDRLRGVALGAAKGDTVALKAADKLNADRRRAEDDAALLTMAIDAAETEERAEQARVAAAKEAARLAEVEAVSAEVVASAGVVDDAARMMVGALERRADALRKLARLGVPATHLNRLGRTETIERSLRAAGLGEFMALPGATSVPHTSIRPLAEIDGNLLAVPH